ncbi:hypothetical protein K9L63_00950 [Candidatus Gracilibacteria bacterium]|nr:hypothetical protein [Candidatus Gracilibacteria bacterium]
MSGNQALPVNAEEKEVVPSHAEREKVQPQKVTKEVIDSSLESADAGSRLEVLDTDVTRNQKKMLRVAESFVPGFSQNKDTIEQYAGKLSSEKEMQITAQNIEQIQKKEKLFSFLLHLGSGKKGVSEKPLAIFDSLSEKYIGRDEKNKRKFLSFAEVVGEDPEEKNVLKKIWSVICHPLEALKYLFFSQYKKELMAYNFVRDTEDNIEQAVQKGEEIKDETQNVLHQTEETRNRVTSLRKSGGKLEIKQDFETAKLRSQKWQREAEERLRMIAQDGPEKFAEKMSGSATKTMQDIESMGAAGVRAVEKGKFSGFSIRHTASGAAIAFSILTLKDAFRSLRHGGNLDELKAEVTQTGWWGDMAELLPVVGSVKSLDRLDDYSTGMPAWARWAEFGLNVGLDGLFIVPIAVGTLAGGLPGAGLAFARAGIGKGATTGIRSIAKMFGKKGLKEMAELGTEKLGKMGLKEGAEKLGKEALGEGVEKAAKKGAVKLSAREAGLELTKGILKKMTPKNWKTLWPVLWKQGAIQGGMEGLFSVVDWSWDNFAKRKTIQIATNTAMGQLTPGQRKTVQTVQKLRH